MELALLWADQKFLSSLILEGVLIRVVPLAFISCQRIPKFNFHYSSHTRESYSLLTNVQCISD